MRSSHSKLLKLAQLEIAADGRAKWRLNGASTVVHTSGKQHEDCRTACTQRVGKQNVQLLQDVARPARSIGCRLTRGRTA